MQNIDVIEIKHALIFDCSDTPMDKISFHLLGTNVTLRCRMFTSKLKHVYIEHIMRYK
jgi:aspartate/glutamate racemase